MINIISKSYFRYATSGPKKVVDNLIKGLKLINYPYVINRRLDACQRLWIHDDLRALRQLNSLPPSVRVVVGPNLALLPGHLPKEINLSKAAYLLPSRWALEFWKTLGYNGSYNIEIWPSGIDTYEYRPDPGFKNLVLVYFKQRYPDELAKVKEVLRQRSLNFKVLRYGSYLDNEFKRLLAQSRYVIWLGRHETQGIALEEVLACDIPILLCDVKTVGHWQASRREMSAFSQADKDFSQATAAEYFSPECGLRLYNLEDFPKILEDMENNLASFKPRKFITENLSLEKQARAFVEIYQKYFNLSFQEGLREKILKQGNWVNGNWQHQLTGGVKDLLKVVLRKL